jgi:hypothetical protein
MAAARSPRSGTNPAGGRFAARSQVGKRRVSAFAHHARAGDPAKEVRAAHTALNE